MSGIKEIFKELDEMQKMMVKLGDNKDIYVEGKGTIVIKTNHDKVKLLYDVQLIPNLAHNLLSIGQLMSSGCLVLFDMELVFLKIKKKSGQSMVNIHMISNKSVSS